MTRILQKQTVRSFEWRRRYFSFGHKRSFSTITNSLRAFSPQSSTTFCPYCISFLPDFHSYVRHLKGAAHHTRRIAFQKTTSTSTHFPVFITFLPNELPMIEDITSTFRNEWDQSEAGYLPHIAKSVQERSYTRTLLAAQACQQVRMTTYLFFLDVQYDKLNHDILFLG
eukprot:TRINITY_DN17178_c0_g1::TRINITY_DN17178_c0_g1_i1::g.11729::m.11729 TRINITY_DN17178_c0_g1::TRINITY_DN17178_c0_g1_i1::g.11729  ORF type:complete len:169 (-),score=25.79,zf-U1/PF06220.7/0.11 TRINITY_DN17178_c0_g1_i1:315-821(-)